MATDSNTEFLFRGVLAVLAIVVLFPLLMMVFAAPMMGMMGWWWGGGMTGGFSPLWGVGMLVLWLAVLVGIGYVVYRGVSRDSTDRDPALEELRVAYARGDLSQEEFEERQERLGTDR